MHIQTKAKPTFEPIAVVGVSCRFPGAPNLEAFAELLARGGDAVTEIPSTRWTRESYFHADPKQAGKMYTTAAGVIDDVDRFDAAFFGISPREAVQMDPQQRLLLELTHEAFEDAGIPTRRLAGTRTGVYVGGSSSDYLALRLGDPAVADAYFMTGGTLSTLSNRISYVFDLKGPSFTVDTACSSSLVALHLACSAMRRGEVDLAVVAGVNLLLSPQSYVGFSRALMLSPRGRCHAFGDGADGYVRAEGGGVVLLKPLEAALADGDVIRAVIEGTGVNSDGRTAGISLPSGTAQAALLREVYGASRIDPADLVYVEAHGTGTAVGDPIEARALGEVLGQGRSELLPIGSVKTNIGHLEAGSGMAGLLKAMLVLRDGMIPASLHSETLNPDIDFDGLNLVVAREQMPVLPNGRRRAAAVNSFGFGGTNAHAVLSAAPEPTASDTALPEIAVPNPAEPAELPPLLLSARSDAALASLADAWRNRLQGLSSLQAAPLLRAAARGREQHASRLVATGATPLRLVAALEAHAARRDDPDIATGTALPSGSVAFIYAGNGSQWAGMAADGLQDRRFPRRHRGGGRRAASAAGLGRDGPPHQRRPRHHAPHGRRTAAAVRHPARLHRRARRPRRRRLRPSRPQRRRGGRGPRVGRPVAPRCRPGHRHPLRRPAAHRPPGRHGRPGPGRRRGPAAARHGAGRRDRRRQQPLVHHRRRARPGLAAAGTAGHPAPRPLRRARPRLLVPQRGDGPHPRQPAARAGGHPPRPHAGSVLLHRLRPRP